MRYRIGTYKLRKRKERFFEICVPMIFIDDNQLEGGQDLQIYRDTARPGELIVSGQPDEKIK
tara:strand:- start:1695 stop:1880 length:186 start_codon:yes stop_codon:yes gene_type:complete